MSNRKENGHTEKRVPEQVELGPSMIVNILVLVLSTGSGGLLVIIYEHYL